MHEPLPQPFIRGDIAAIAAATNLHKTQVSKYIRGKFKRVPHAIVQLVQPHVDRIMTERVPSKKQSASQKKSDQKRRPAAPGQK